MGGKYFIHADLKKFFNNVNRSRITRELKPYLGYEAARKFAMDSTVAIPLDKGQIFGLPFGFVQSTIIASLCLDKSTLGKCIRNLNHSKNVNISIYVDDIIISTQTLEAAQNALELIEASALKARLPLNDSKLEGPAQTITAFNIIISQNLMAITPTRFGELYETYQNSGSDKQREGIRSYVYSVCPSQAYSLDY